MNLKPIVLAVGIFACAFDSPVNAAGPEATKPEAQVQEPQVQILTANIDRTYHDDKPKNTFVITGPANLTIKKTNVISEGEDDSNFTVTLTTDNFSREVGSTLVVKVRDKVFVPYAYGGDEKAYWSLELRDVDGASAEILNGGALPKAPKESFKVEYTPLEQEYPLQRPVQVSLQLTNIGQAPLTIHWGTHGGGNYPTRDTQLSFTATLDGAPVPANPNPLPDGFISSPFVSKPKSALRRGVDLTQWLQFQKPGKYLVDAAYTLEIVNPQEGASPSRWKVTYHNQFSVVIGN